MDSLRTMVQKSVFKAEHPLGKYCREMLAWDCYALVMHELVSRTIDDLSSYVACAINKKICLTWQ